MAKVPVFISWSGDYAGDVANALRTFFQCSLQATKPFVSTRDIAPGTPWFEKVRTELQAAPIGIICVTKEGLDARWLNFEAGAMAMVHGKERVIPYCIDITKDKCGSPLNQLQAVDSDESGTFDMFQAINDVLGDGKVDDPRTVFDMWYPKLKEERDNADEREAKKRGTKDVEVEGPSTDERLKNIEEKLDGIASALTEESFRSLVTDRDDDPDAFRRRRAKSRSALVKQLVLIELVNKIVSNSLAGDRHEDLVQALIPLVRDEVERRLVGRSGLHPSSIIETVLRYYLERIEAGETIEDIRQQPR